MKNKWELIIKKSYIDLKFVFQNAEHMARFLNFFMDVYVEESEKDKIKMNISMVTEEEEEEEKQ